jgi:hypothetical protein
MAWGCEAMAPVGSLWPCERVFDGLSVREHILDAGSMFPLEEMDERSLSTLFPIDSLLHTLSLMSLV